MSVAIENEETQPHTLPGPWSKGEWFDHCTYTAPVLSWKSLYRRTTTTMQCIVNALRIFSIHFSQDYSVPDFFSEADDFLTNLEDDLRLDWRWIIMAAKRSGSGWHCDPANTTGWLALVQGTKLWGMYPPSVFHIPGEWGSKANFFQALLIGFINCLMSYLQPWTKMVEKVSLQYYCPWIRCRKRLNRSFNIYTIGNLT